MDKLDLLGVKHDYEMELQAKYDLAEKVYSFWNSKCEKCQSNYKDLKENCLLTISFELKTDVNSDETKEIWNIIRGEFMNNEDDEKYFNNGVVYYADDGEYELNFNEYKITKSYSIVDNILCGHKIAQEICTNMKEKIIRDDGEYDIGTICEMIDEECLNEMRINIQSHVEEYLNKHLEVD